MTKETSSLRSPLSAARGLGSAKDGVKHWMMLRVTSIPLAFLFFYFLGQLDHLAVRDRMEFVNWVEQPVPAVALLIFIICSFYHACLGMEEVIMDYIPSRGKKVAAGILNKMFFFGLGTASVYAVLAISFGKI